MSSADIEMNPAGVQVTVQDESAAGAEPGDGVGKQIDPVGWLTKDWLDKLKADFPPESRIPLAGLPFSLPSDKASSCFLLAVLSNSFVFNLLMNFFSIFSNMAGMVATMDSAMSSVFSGPNPFIPFDEERFNEFVNKYDNGAYWYAVTTKTQGTWLYILLGLLMFLVLMASTQIISEFTRREWIYYELLQHGTLVDFKNRGGHLQFVRSVKLFWVIVLFTLLMLVSINCVEFQLQPTFTTLLLFWTLHTSLKSSQEMETRLVNLNALVDKRSRSETDMGVGSMANDFLSKLMVVDESAVQYHIKLILLVNTYRDQRARDIARDHPILQATGATPTHMIYKPAEYTQLYEGGLMTLDFGKLGRHGYTKEDYQQKAHVYGVSTGCFRSVMNCLSDGGADFWASSLTPMIYNPVPMEDEEAAKKLKTLGTCHYLCVICSVCFLVVLGFYPLISLGFATEPKRFPKDCDYGSGNVGSGSGAI